MEAEGIDPFSEVKTEWNKEEEEIRNLLFTCLHEVSGFKDEDILHIMLWGSRAYLCHTNDSDWDFVVIVADGIQYKEIEREHLNVHIIPKSTFETSVKENELQALMAVFLPQRCLWRKGLNLKVKINFKKLLRAVHKEASRHFHTGAKRLFGENDIYRAKKWARFGILTKELIASYSIRDYLLGLQMIEHGRITDFTVANEFYKQIMKDEVPDWETCQKLYEPYYTELKTRFEKSLLQLESISLGNMNNNPVVVESSQRMLPTVQFLLTKGLDSLAQVFSVVVTRHQVHSQLLHLRVNEKEFDRTSVVSQECNGLVVDESDNYKVICYPFPYYFNHNEKSLIPKMNFKTCLVYPYICGTFVALYYYQNAWHTSTNSAPDGSNILEIRSGTVSECFWKTWNSLGYQMPTNINLCYMFQLLLSADNVNNDTTKYSSPFHFFRYNGPDAIVLVGARDLDTLYEVELAGVASQHGWKAAEAFSKDHFKSLKEVTDASLLLDPFVSKGFMVVDSGKQVGEQFDYQRIKMKSPQFIALEGLPSSKSPEENMVDICVRLTAQGRDTFRNMFPAWRELFEKVENHHLSMCKDLQHIFDTLQTVQDFKEFSTKLNQLDEKYQPFKSILFDMRKYQFTSVEEFSRTLEPKHVRQYYGLWK